MTTRSFVLTTSVPVGPHEAIDFLTDLARHRGLHPYLVSAEIVASGTGPDGPWQDWQVVERPRLGPLRYTLRFPARVERSADDVMTSSVHAAPGCTLRTVTRATPDPDGAVLTENTEVAAPWPVAGYMTRHARAAHVRTFELLPAELGR
ncbi:hypothetical protein [Promicromonospora kroppenstedtii]|uniref:hypothetical protein n=1 Tax=Promicromonospora kroppenstedtii TaxID=440482 RepID=UPI0004AE4EAE|nr:hypothetical protein [Promicromonospora kroppenstedtii]